MPPADPKPYQVRRAARAADTDYHRAHSAEELTRQNVEAIARLEEAANARRSRGDVIADAIATFCGSTAFVWVHVVWFAGWMTLNVMPGVPHFDRFPFQLLNLVVSLEAVFLTTFVMISQNRQGRLADRRNHLDLQINLLAEQENSKMLAMLGAIMERLGIEDGDPEVRVLEEATRPEAMMEQIEAAMQNRERSSDEGNGANLVGAEDIA